ncbi:MAG: ABC transporter permease [Bacteroidetes bacterium]|nr:ABC transporter permease [Bacteroidota bacterium]
MLDIDKWQEISSNLWQHKLRTFMIAILVSWGIFMLVFLLGAGKGLQNGVERQFQGFAKNTMWIWTWKTAMAYNGLPPGRVINLDLDDYQQIKTKLKGIEEITPRLGLWGTLVNRKEKNGSYNVLGIDASYFKIAQLELLQGRYINESDVKEKKKTIVIGKIVAENLFKPDEEILGQYLNIKGVYFKIVGVFASKSFGEEAKDDEEAIFLSYSAVQQSFNFGNRIGNLIVSIADGYDSEDIKIEIKKVLNANHRIHPDDDMAIGAWSSQAQFKIFNGLFMGINGFIIFVALGTIFAGMIAISVIMMITVKERTREIGVRKALGATPSSIVLLIMQEALFINIISGIFGLIAGVFLIDKLGQVLETMGFENEYFYNPEVDLSVAVAALFALILSGLLAGLFPAINAAKIKPIEALRAD